MKRLETLRFLGKMASMDENELVHKLFEVGKRLEHPLQSNDDLVQGLEVNFHLKKHIHIYLPGFSMILFPQILVVFVYTVFIFIN